MGSHQLGETSSVRIRAFFGLPIAAAARQALDTYLTACSAIAPEFRWTPAGNLHVTVRFLGQVEQTLAEGIMDRLGVLELPAFGLRLGPPGAFKRGRLARVVWLGLASGEAEMSEVAARVEAECVRAGLVPENRKFHAHVTLARARARDGASLPALPSPPEVAPWRAVELILYRSRLGRAGSVYEPLRTLRLR